ncbi:MAG: hypothetical protein F4Z86_12410 [Gemmatimonadetes bacterium]|nr:hypothetical protein [Gemmatimonadota bacterium]MYB54940.1 hypothetical protein [Gemmatimonadota bacterium]
MGPNGLQATIEKLQDKIRAHYFHLHNIETAVRQVLIDPLLLALEWDVSDPNQVWLEYPTGVGQADYVLVSNNTPVAVIEAKSLRNSPLTDCIINQALKHANALGTNYMVITNGGEWRMYNVAQQPTILMSFLITQTPVLESSLQALRMWKPNLASGNPAPAFASPPAWVSLTIPINITSHNTNPEHIRFRDGQIGNINPPYYERNILIQTATWLTNNGYLTPATAPLLRPWLRGTRWYIFNTQPQHPNGQDFSVRKLVGADVYIETQWEPEQCIVAARALLEHCGVDPDTVQVSFE